MNLDEVQALMSAAYASNALNPLLIKPLEMLGDGAFLFTAFKALDAGDSETARFCLEAGLLFEKQPVYKERIRNLLLEDYAQLEKYEDVLRLTEAPLGTAGLSSRQKLLKARALLGLGRFGDALALWTELQGSSAASSFEIDEALVECVAKTDADANKVWIDKKIQAFLDSPRSVALTSALERLLAVSELSLSGDTAMRVLLRVLVGKQDYGTAVRLFKSYVRSSIAGTMKKPEREKDPENPEAGGDAALAEPALEELAAVFGNLPYSVAADMCRAFQYGDADTGLRLLTYVYENSQSTSFGFLSAYYLGQIFRAKKIDDSAVAWFSKAEKAAHNKDADNQAVWYQIDLLADSEPQRALEKFTAVLKRTNRPDYFADVLERMSRNALAAKNGAMLAELDKAVFAYGSGAYKARMAYIAAQAAQYGIITQKNLDASFGKTKTLKSYINERLGWVQAQNSELWFKLLAAYRLGLALVPDAWRQPETGDSMKEPGSNVTVFSLLDKSPHALGVEASQGTASTQSPEGAQPTEGVQAQQIQQGRAGTADAQAALYFHGLFAWNLRERIIGEIAAYPEIVSAEILRQLADYLYTKGEYNLAIRVITELTRRADYSMRDFDRKIYWPLAYPEEMRKALELRSLNRWIQYALIRSESLFKPDAVSKSGAMGLGQFMPATAQDMAQRLKLAAYDLMNPADSLLLSAFYFQGLVNQFDGQVLPAVWSYNAGPGRYTQWEKQFASLPFDLFMETIPISETQQYGKNIGRSAVLYAAIYEKSDGKSLLAYYLGEKSQ